MMDKIKTIAVVAILVGALFYGVKTTSDAYLECKNGGTVVRGIYKAECIKNVR